jgi:hypothetical protein
VSNARFERAWIFALTSCGETHVTSLLQASAYSLCKTEQRSNLVRRTAMALPTSPETSDHSFGALQIPLDQSSAFSLEVQALTKPTPVTDHAVAKAQATTNNSSVENLPPVVIHGDTAHTQKAAFYNAPDNQRLGEFTNVAIDVGLAAVAMYGAEALIGLATKNPEIVAMAGESLAEGGKIGLSGPLFWLGATTTYEATLGSAMVARHYMVSALGKPESWIDSGFNIAGGSALVFTRLKLPKLLAKWIPDKL